MTCLIFTHMINVKIFQNIMQPENPSFNLSLIKCKRVGGARWWRSRRLKFCLVPGIQLDSYQTILNTYELNRRSKTRLAQFYKQKSDPFLEGYIEQY